MNFRVKKGFILMIMIKLLLSLPMIHVAMVETSVQASARQRSQPPPPAGRPPNRKDGGKRGSCLVSETQTHQDFTALVPEHGEMHSLTATPTLWFYVPHASTTVPLVARFSLRDREGSRAVLAGVPFAPMVIPLSNTPGIIGIRLPKPLEPETEYHWYLTLICAGSEDGPGVDGWLRLVKPDTSLLRQLNQASSWQERLALYKRANLWADRLTLLAEVRDRETSLGENLPSQARVEWAKTLQEIGLAELAQEPIVSCCALK